ncbi:hypothetical protein [Streptomyces sp. NBC_01716]|uniref:hypothetical protein n=1 Tax=Streptomyces sp. NBC_01716 TaxID=2975917 RepID=UPI002E361DC8|nr:hypothetical protein [Streptomyces sp. NBC_01716]
MFRPSSTVLHEAGEIRELHGLVSLEIVLGQPGHVRLDRGRGHAGSRRPGGTASHCDSDGTVGRLLFLGDLAYPVIKMIFENSEAAGNSCDCVVGWRWVGVSGLAEWMFW